MLVFDTSAKNHLNYDLTWTTHIPLFFTNLNLKMVSFKVSINNKSYFLIQATTFLILGGGIVCATTALKLIAFWTPCECDDKIMDIVSPIADFVHFCVII